MSIEVTRRYDAQLPVGLLWVSPRGSKVVERMGIADALRLRDELTVAVQWAMDTEARRNGVWHRAQDKLPDDGRDVLTFGSYGVHKGCFEWGANDDPCWWSSDVLAGGFRTSVTHWREMPE